MLAAGRAGLESGRCGPVLPHSPALRVASRGSASPPNCNSTLLRALWLRNHLRELELHQISTPGGEIG